jgi:hypothetical protein
MQLITRMQELQANRLGNQWHPRVQIPVEKRAPHQRFHIIQSVHNMRRCKPWFQGHTINGTITCNKRQCKLPMDRMHCRFNAVFVTLIQRGMPPLSFNPCYACLWWHIKVNYHHFLCVALQYVQPFGTVVCSGVAQVDDYPAATVGTLWASIDQWSLDGKSGSIMVVFLHQLTGAHPTFMVALVIDSIIL